MGNSSGHVDEELDVRGLGCAAVLIELAVLARTRTKPWVVDVLTDDLGAPSELPSWCRLTGNMFVGPSVPTVARPGPCYTLILQAKENS